MFGECGHARGYGVYLMNSGPGPIGLIFRREIGVGKVSTAACRGRAISRSFGWHNNGSSTSDSGAMGYCHYWEMEREVDGASFSRIVSDGQKIILVLDDVGVRLAGPVGVGLAEIDTEHIAFNGLWHCGHPKNQEIAIPFPSADAAGVGKSIDAVEGSYYGMGTLLRHRTCDGNCSYETFELKRKIEDFASLSDGRYSNYCKTGFRPYDLAVQGVLLVAKHHLRDRIQVWSGGSDFHWNDARRLCYVHLGYPLNQYRVDREAGLTLI